jgi:hypothetical protein
MCHIQDQEDIKIYRNRGSMWNPPEEASIVKHQYNAKIEFHKINSAIIIEVILCVVIVFGRNGQHFKIISNILN